MSKSKLFFSDLNPEFTMELSEIKNEMKRLGIESIKIYPAVREIGVSHYFCNAVGEVGERGSDYDPCGKSCGTYKPRNGKSGCCTHRGYCYAPGDAIVLKLS